MTGSKASAARAALAARQVDAQLLELAIEVGALEAGLLGDAGHAAVLLRQVELEMGGARDGHLLRLLGQDLSVGGDPFRGEQLPEPERFTLRTGDVLYIPRGDVTVTFGTKVFDDFAAQELRVVGVAGGLGVKF